MSQPLVITALWTKSQAEEAEFSEAGHCVWLFGASLLAQIVKNLPAMWETRVPSLGWEDALEERMATHSSILAWRIPWTEEPGGLQSTGGVAKSQTELNN